MTAVISHIDIERGELVTKRTHARIMREVLKKAATHHLNVTLGKHFKDIPETQPGGAYGYARRDPGYTEAKKKQFGHSLPNVRTGLLRRGIRNNSVIRGTQKQATIQLKAPIRSTKNGRSFGMTDQQRRELTAITDQERNEMSARAAEMYSREVARPKNQRKRRKRV